jgi:hypothetical protein
LKVLGQEARGEAPPAWNGSRIGYGFRC